MFEQFSAKSNHRAARLAVTLASFVALVLIAPLGARGDVTWTLPAGRVGDWSVASNWGGSVPGSSDNAYVLNGGTLSVTQTGEVCNALSLGGSGGTVNMTAGALSAGAVYVGNAGTGSFTQFGGTNNTWGNLYLGYSTGSYGSYNLTGSGQLYTSASEFVGYSGTANFTQNSGANSAGNLTLGNNPNSNGTYNLSGSGQVTASFIYIGSSGSGSVTQSGQSNALSENLYLGNNPGGVGTYNLYGGELKTISPGYVGCLVVGNSGAGIFNQTGGTNDLLSSADVSLYLGYCSGASGTYTLSGTGQLLAANQYVGYSGTGSFTQSGGTNAISGNLSLGCNPGSSGTYNFRGNSVFPPPASISGRTRRLQGYFSNPAARTPSPRSPSAAAAAMP